MLNELFAGPLAVEPRYLEQLLPQLQRAMDTNGPMLAAPTAERLAQFAQPHQVAHGLEQAAGTAGRPTGSKVAIVPLEGVLTKRSSYFSMGYRAVGQWLQQAFNDPEVAGVVLHVDSPGGTVDGNEQLAQLVANAPKPVRVFADGMAASAAYRVASQAKGGITVNSASSSIIGSIGTVQQHVDMSQALEKQGLKVTFMTADRSTHKVLGNPTEPLSEDALAYFKQRLNAANDAFIQDVQQGRKGKLTSKEDVFTAKVYTGADAVKYGLADSIGTLDDAVREVAQLATAGKSSSTSSQTTMKTPFLGAALAALGFIKAPDAELEANADTLAKAEEVLGAAQQQVTTLTQELATEKASVQALTTERDTLQAANTTLEASNTTLTNDLKAANDQVATLEGWKKQQEEMGGHQGDARDQGQGRPKASYNKAADEHRVRMSGNNKAN